MLLTKQTNKQRTENKIMKNKSYTFTTVVFESPTRAAFTILRDAIGATDKLLSQAMWNLLDTEAVTAEVGRLKEAASLIQFEAKAAKKAAKIPVEPKAAPIAKKVEPKKAVKAARPSRSKAVIAERNIGKVSEINELPDHMADDSDMGCMVVDAVS